MKAQRGQIGRARALPALNPNQPNQSRPAPSSDERHVVRHQRRACLIVAPLARRTIAATSAATPALTWTTVPPAKSSAPMSASQPPPQTQCATGQ